MSSSTLTLAGHRSEPAAGPRPGRVRVVGRHAGLVALAAGAAFVTSAAWYTAFAEPYAQLLGPTDAGPSPIATTAIELGRSIAISAVLALLVRRLDTTRVRDGAGIAVLAWAAFPATLMLGSVVHDGVPVALAAIHAGDWLVKLLVVTIILAILQRREHR
jgi:hypothetical protein